MSINQSLMGTSNHHDADNSEELLFEYGELRKEILQNDTLILQIMSVILSLVGLLMGFAITQTQDTIIQSIIFLVCCLLSCFGVYHSTDRMKNTQRISAYLRAFIEPKLSGIKWEQRLAVYRSFRNPSRLNPLEYFKFMTDQRFIYVTIILINAFLGISALLLSFQGSVTFSTATPTSMILIMAPTQLFWFIMTSYLITIVTGLYLTLSTRNKKYTKSFDLIWARVKSAEAIRDE